MSSFTTQATNPFELSDSYVQISFHTSKEVANQAEPYFDDVALSISVFELNEEKGIWQVDVVTDQPVDKADATRRLMLLAEAMGAEVPEVTIIDVEKEMWRHNLHEFPPINIGRYLIHGSHISPEMKSNIYPVCVDAGMAFGSGEHATTEGCLCLFDIYLDALNPRALKRGWRILDMGCGSAILAMAAAKRLHHSHIVAVDIDKVSIQVAKENTKINGVSKQVKCFVGDGYRSRAVSELAPYDLIFANILAKPLMQMARHLHRSLDVGGVAIISGLLASQEKMVLAAHRQVGLRLSKRWQKGEWVALMLRKS